MWKSIEWDDWAWLERNGYPTGEGSIQIHSDNGIDGIYDSGSA